MSHKWENNEAIQRFREYLQIPSVHPDIDYGDCVKFLRKQAAELDLPIAVYELVAKKPIVVITWEGTEPELPSIMLNSHMDVVPVYEEHWTHPPFEAHIADDGFIYGRGTQDMKSVGMIHLEAVRRLKSAGVRLKRTVHVSFVPDEEIGGEDGMKVFSESDAFKKLNIGFEMDESGPNSKPNEFYAFNCERSNRPIKITSKGKPTHGSYLETNTAGEKLHYVIDKFMKFRAEEMKKYVSLGNSPEKLGAVTTVNLTQLQGGVQVNVLPENLYAFFDIRVSPLRDHEEFDKMISSWCAEAGEDVTFEYIRDDPHCRPAGTDANEPFYETLVKTVGDMGLKVNCLICPGATDARFVRQQGIPAINLTPIRNTKTLLHCHDEKLHAEEFLKGIDVMEKVLEAVANV